MAPNYVLFQMEMKQIKMQPCTNLRNKEEENERVRHPSIRYVWRLVSPSKKRTVSNKSRLQQSKASEECLNRQDEANPNFGQVPWKYHDCPWALLYRTLSSRCHYL